MNKKRDRISVGGASIILIMLVLALSSFALLAIRSSMNEKRLALKTANSIQEYYDMDAEATEIYAKINTIATLSSDKIPNFAPLLKEYPDTMKIEYGEGNSYLIKYSVKKGDRTLHVEVNGEGMDSSIQRWSTKTASEDGLYEIQITD